jgi:hypothetical protein
VYTSFLPGGNTCLVPAVDLPGSTAAKTIDPSGTPYLACTDAGDGTVTVMKYAGGSWQAVGTPGFSEFEVE